MHPNPGLQLFIVRKLLTTQGNHTWSLVKSVGIKSIFFVFLKQLNSSELPHINS